MTERQRQHAAPHHDHGLQYIDVDDVVAETFALWRRLWQEQGHAGPIPRTFRVRAAHVAETDTIARAEAEQPLLTLRRLGVEGIARACIGFKGTEDNPTTPDIDRVFQGRRTTYNFWIDHELALVGSPEKVIRLRKVQHQRPGDDSCCANHRMGPMPLELSLTSLQLFGTEVISAFP